MNEVIKMKLFETYPQVKKFTQPNDLTRIKVVIQDTKKVVTVITGLEPMLFMYLWRNMKKNQFALVFNNDTEEMYGYISKNENGIPQRYLEMEKLYFKDMYEIKDVE